ncbi:MAG: hypothetical protein WD467_01780 [Candidatus Saccharimonadales bacterium]
MQLSTGMIRAIVVFIITASFIWMLLYLIGQVGLNFFAEPLLIIIGAGWAAYYIWKKTEYGRY